MSSARSTTRYSKRAVAEVDLFDYIEPFYNRRRQHSTLGYASPMKFLENWISNWQHNAVGLEEEKQREAHFLSWGYFVAKEDTFLVR